MANGDVRNSNQVDWAAELLRPVTKFQSPFSGTEVFSAGILRTGSAAEAKQLNLPFAITRQSYVRVFPRRLQDLGSEDPIGDLVDVAQKAIGAASNSLTSKDFDKDTPRRMRMVGNAVYLPLCLLFAGVAVWIASTSWQDYQSDVRILNDGKKTEATITGWTDYPGGNICCSGSVSPLLYRPAQAIGIFNKPVLYPVGMPLASYPPGHWQANITYIVAGNTYAGILPSSGVLDEIQFHQGTTVEVLYDPQMPDRYLPVSNQPDPTNNFTLLSGVALFFATLSWIFLAAFLSTRPPKGRRAQFLPI